MFALAVQAPHQFFSTPTASVENNTPKLKGWVRPKKSMVTFIWQRQLEQVSIGWWLPNLTGFVGTRDIPIACLRWIRKTMTETMPKSTKVLIQMTRMAGVSGEWKLKLWMKLAMRTVTQSSRRHLQSSGPGISLTMKWPMEFHVPCRDSLDHLLSQCNDRHITFNCSTPHTVWWRWIASA